MSLLNFTIRRTQGGFYVDEEFTQGSKIVKFYAEGQTFVSLKYEINSGILFAQNELGLFSSIRAFRMHVPYLGEERTYIVDENLPYHGSFIGDYEIKVMEEEDFWEEEDEGWEEDFQD